MIMTRNGERDDEEESRLNYFVCTLGEAAAINAKNPHPWKTINNFIDYQASKYSANPAVAFPAPSGSTHKDSEWGHLIYSRCD